MSYNITNCKVLQMSQFALPSGILLDAKLKPWIKVLKNDPLSNQVILSASEGQIEGTLSDDKQFINVTKFSLYGAGSGYVFNGIESFLEQSQGTLQLRLVWENGDAIEDVVISNGAIARTDV